MPVPHPDPRVSPCRTIPAVDLAPVEGGKRCSRCGRVKPLAAFPPGSKCRVCRRHYDAERRAAGLVKRRTAAQATAAQRRWRATPAGRAVHDAWRQSVTGRLSACLATLRYRLRHATGPAHRARLELRIAQLTAELDRLRHSKDD